MTAKKDSSEKELTYSEKDYSKEAMLDRIKFYENQQEIKFSNLKKNFCNTLSIKLDKENFIKVKIDRMEKTLFHENGNLKEPYKSIENGTKKINYNTSLFGITKNKDGHRIKMGSQAQKYLYYTTGLMYYNWLKAYPSNEIEYLQITSTRKQSDLKKLNKLQINDKIENLKDDLISLFTLKNPKNNEPYMSETDVNYFINQNFEALEGVLQIKSFTPNMNKTELRHSIWLLYNKYHLSKQKSLWHKMFNVNFPNHQTKEISNLKDYSINYLKL